MHIFRNVLAFSLLFFSFYIHAQIDNNEISSFKKNERRIVKEIQKLVNTRGKREEAYNKVHEQFNKKGFKSDRFKADLSLILSSYFKNKSQIDSSKYYAQKILSLKNFDNDTIKHEIYGLSYNLLGMIDAKIGLNEKSKKWHLKGIDLSLKYDDKRIYYVNSFGLANVYIATSEHEAALELFKKCVKYTENSEMVFGSYVNIATIYGNWEQYDETIKYLEKARELCTKAKRYSCIGTISINLAITYKKLGNVDQALLTFDEAIEIATTNKYHKMEIIGNVEKGRVLNDQKKHKEAEEIMLLALEKAKTVGFLNEQKKIFYRLKEVSVSQNDYKKALAYQEKYHEVIDSTRSLDKDEEINELEVKYKTLQKEKEIKFLQIENTNRALELANREEAIRNLKLKQEIEHKENEIEKKENENKMLSFQNTTDKTLKDNIILKKNQELKILEIKRQQEETSRQKTFKYIILYSFLILLIPVIGLLITYYQKIKAQSELNQKQKEINQEKISSLLKDQELKVIKASVAGQDKERKRIAQELHDSIGGNLAAIKLQLNNSHNNGSNKSHLKTINIQIDDTYELVRSLSHNLIPKKFTKNNFCDVIEEYFTNIGGASSLDTSFSAYPRKTIDLLEEAIKIETFKIIQELITNTIKHAKATSITLQLNLFENELSILFEDNGIGFELNKNGEGIGFTNIRSRLKKISGVIDIDSRIKRGTIINITITNLITATNEV
ncbi:tetratricopeptide repeat-containing sensor histidine kinase [Aquimarina sp. 2201CG14-23]|uniref:tetratricopeptide repeat-containing sensor histidine kinase n=1 Tax=Aquimarina mycalae TaxID=3040073 RepID=UPI002478190F|nr:tetratricopeptide repeat-containing sensor histidine kinase [Aquimarina sp. 2201CG14-23]MDH7444928.1 tetratricopeptide repeat protein [Aquimarina sp. 2201CG14-23]